MKRQFSCSILLILLSLAACGDSTGPGGGGGGDATLSGTVRAAGSAAGLADATVSVGARSAMSDASGNFELTGLSTGAATVRAERPGYLPAEAAVTISAGANTRNFTLDPQEIYESGAYAAFVPAGAGPLRGAIIMLGGPMTNGFVTGEPLTQGNPPLEASLQALGVSLRALAASAHVVLLGSRTTAMANSAANDAALFGALATFAERSGRAELTSLPVLISGFSGGAPEAAGLAARNPGRTIGLLVRVPVDVTSVTDPAALGVPAFVMQAQLDNVVNNPAVALKFAGNRSRGGRWALAVEPGVGHSEATSEANAAVIGWMSAAMALRLPATAGDPLIALDETSGWLGDQTTYDIASWDTYAGTASSASWLLSESIASAWQALQTSGPPGGGD